MGIAERTPYGRAQDELARIENPGERLEEFGAQRRILALEIQHGNGLLDAASGVRRGRF